MYGLKLAAQLHRNMEKGSRSVFFAAAFLFQGETCNIPDTVNREKGVAEAMILVIQELLSPAS